MTRHLPLACAAAALLLARADEPRGTTFAGEFAATGTWVKSLEKPFRAEVCLNGRWQFQAVPVPGDFIRGRGDAPAMPMPRPEGWDPTPVKIPSPWNVNTWGGGRNVGPGTAHPFRPDSIYFPSYPAAWDHVAMAWMRRTFRVPDEWEKRRVLVHFEAVAGDCQVLVNGRAAGTHFDKYLPFEVDVTDLMLRDGDNELLVGVRAHALFDKQSPVHPKMTRPYPCGSNTEGLAGIWQDVFLLGLPPLRVDDVFVKPLVDQDLLEVEITLRNDSNDSHNVTVEGEVYPWPEKATTPPSLTLAATPVTVGARKTAKLTLRQSVNHRLKPWTPGTPNLHGLLLTVKQDDRQLDRQFTRFGWRQFKIRGKELLLNGQPIQLFGDFLHPFGPFILSPDYARAWYQFIRDFGGNSARPHAQPHPRHYLDIADESGIIVLDETAIFGSSITLNFEEEVAWQRFASHYDGLVLRDRNHPCVVGWSFGNELFAIFDHNQVPQETADAWYRRLAGLGARARMLDPTREWISCDGDEDLRGTLPVWSKHFGHGTPPGQLPVIDKPLMVGESGGTYYARPKQLAEFNGARAYESYIGRNEALAIDVHENIVRMARPRLAYYSASETAWFGAWHLPFGYRDLTRPPGITDGVFFTRPFEEGKPGIQPERLPPHVATLNPGWDRSLPRYQALPMFEAQKAALAKNGAEPSPWSRKDVMAPRPEAAPPTIDKVGFTGHPQGTLARRLRALGVPLAEGPQLFTIVDGGDLAGQVSRQDSGGTTLVLLAGATPAAYENHGCQRTERTATALVPDPAHPWTAPFGLPDLYFAEDGPDRFIMRHGIGGAARERGRVLLRASETDWSLFLDAPEHSKCAAVIANERLIKPSGAALVEIDSPDGKLLLCSVDWRPATRSSNTFWRRLFLNAGIRLAEAAESAPVAFDEDGVLVNARVIGRFPAATLEAAMTTDFIGESDGRGCRAPAGYRWQAVNCPSRDRFLLHQLPHGGPEQSPFVVYFSCWLNSPRALDELLEGGPDAPRLGALCYVSDDSRMFLNGSEIKTTRNEKADYRTLRIHERLPLRKGWNHLLVKVASSKLRGEQPATLAVRLNSNQASFLRQIESAVEPGGTHAE